MISLGSTAAASSVGGRSCDEQNRKIPLRIIDVEATIKNREGGGICFTRSPSWHIISHTWSEDIREFSEIIGEKLIEAKARGELSSYEKLFESAGFSECESYHKLVEFLKVLETDQVRWVWFDALCIDQTDREEKEKEIPHMATYYERSLGCYVVHHGIGKGFEVLDDGDELPRWFSRVWTFQEWVLPKKITFIVDLALEKSLTTTANAIMRDDEGRGGPCSCCLYEFTFSPVFIRKCMRSSKADTEEEEEEEEELVCSERGREFCRGGPHFKKTPGRRDWYFADDLGYAFLARVKLQVKNAGIHAGIVGGIIQQKEVLSDAESQLVERLQLKASFRGQSFYRMSREKEMPLAIEEISQRDCSNEEDRVLSMLKLLGVEEVIQWRTGKSLDAQVIHLGKSLVEKQGELLVRLCLVDGWGNETPGMSWAPHFQVKKDSWQEGVRKLAERLLLSQYFYKFECGAKVKEVLSEGGLRVESYVVCGQLICYEHGEKVDKVRKKPNELSKGMALEVDGQVVLHLCARSSAEDVRDACVLEPVPKHGNTCIVFTAPRIHKRLHHLLERIPVWLVRMGVGYKPYEDSTMYTYFLVCIGKQGGPLHKIGFLDVSSQGPLDQSASLLPNQIPSTPTTCTIGGFGRDLSAYVLQSWTEIVRKWAFRIVSNLLYGLLKYVRKKWERQQQHHVE